jgi:integrase
MKGSVIRYDGARGTVYRIKYRDVDGKQCMETVGPDRREAEKLLHAKVVDVDKGYRRPEKRLFAEYAEHWFRAEAKKRAWKPQTVKKYRVVEKRLIGYFGPMRLEEVRRRHVAAFIDQHELGASSVRCDVAVLHAIFETALVSELVQANPAHGLELPKLPPFRPVLLTPAEFARTAAAFTDPQFRLIYLCTHLTGLRVSELQELRWRDLSMLDRELRVTDSKSEDGRRLIAIPEALAEEFGRHYQLTGFKGDDERVFTTGTGGKAWTTAFSDAHRRALKSAGVAKTPRPTHDGRHEVLTKLASITTPAALQHIAGHSSFQTTQKYIHLAGTTFPNEMEQLAARQLSTEVSTVLTEPQVTSGDLNGSSNTL